jgi:4-hydroxybenzoate polyprenyltransferase
MDFVSERSSVSSKPAPLEIVKLFLGLSRTPHGLLDLATPAMAALLWLGALPPISVVFVGLMTAFAGYTAVYALNDLVDYRVDQERLSLRDDAKSLFDVDEIMVRHPVAQGMLSLGSGAWWFAAWSVVAVAGALWLNPLCAALFSLCAALEVLYCRLLRITHLKIVPSALVKASGGLVGVLAVDPHPSLGFLAIFVFWLAAWEIGGQNIANDIIDMDEDKRVKARTTATVKGLQESVFILLVAVSMAASAGILVYWFAGEGVGHLYPFGAAVLGWTLLIEPARKVYYDPGPATAAVLFNRASYMPWGFLLLIVLAIHFRI